MYKYEIFGFKVLSAMCLQHCVNADFKSEDIKIRFDKIDTLIESEQSAELLIADSSNNVLFVVKDMAAFQISNGNDVVIDNIGKVDNKFLEVFLLGSVFGILMMQRNIYPFHGSCIYKDGIGILIVGETGVGKSTLAKTFLNHGFSFLSDDVTRVVYENGLIAVPSYPYQKLHDDMINDLDIDQHLLVPTKLDKRYVGLKDEFHGETVEIDYYIELCQRSNYGLKKMNFKELLVSMINNSYRFEMIGMLDKQADHFKQVNRYLPHLKGYRISRNKSMTPEVCFNLLYEIIRRKDVHSTKEFNNS